MKTTINSSQEILSRHTSCTRDELVKMLDEAIAALPSECRESASFEIDIETFPYDDGEYPKLFMLYKRPETDIEQKKREDDIAACRAAHEAREKLEFKRLSAKFAK